MTLRSIQWIADSGLLVGLTTFDEFTASPDLAELSLSSTNFTLTLPASGAIRGATAGSAITAVGLPSGFSVNSAPGWAYDGSGTAGSYTFVLSETLSGSANSPQSTSITVSIAPPGGALDFSLSANSGLIAGLRSF